MGHAKEQEKRLFIPERDLTYIARPRPALALPEHNHKEQVAKAATLVFMRYENALFELSKV